MDSKQTRQQSDVFRQQQKPKDNGVDDLLLKEASSCFVKTGTSANPNLEMP